VNESAGSNRGLFDLIAVLALAGVAVSGISLQRHYAKSVTTYCDFNQKLNCDIVNRSEFSTIADIPVAGIGVTGYILLFLLATLWRSRPDTPNLLLAAASTGFLFSLYLTCVEAFKLMTWCVLCIASQCLIFLIAVLAGIVKLRTAKE